MLSLINSNRCGQYAWNINSQNYFNNCVWLFQRLLRATSHSFLENRASCSDPFYWSRIFFLLNWTQLAIERPKVIPSFLHCSIGVSFVLLAFAQLIRMAKLNYWSIDRIVPKIKGEEVSSTMELLRNASSNRHTFIYSFLSLVIKHKDEKRKSVAFSFPLECFEVPSFWDGFSFLFSFNCKLWAIKFNRNEHISRAKMGEKWIMNT